MLSSSFKIVAEVKAHSRVRIPDICLSFKFTIFFNNLNHNRREYIHMHLNMKIKN